MKSRTHMKSAKRTHPSIKSAAVIVIDGILALEDRPFPREVGMAYGDGRPGLAWLVAPEASWSLIGSAHAIGFGLPPPTVARAIADAVSGCCLYADFHVAAGSWLRKLFLAADEELTFEPRDLRRLIFGTGKRQKGFLQEDVYQADLASRQLYPGSARAARDAACYVAFVRMLLASRR